MIERTFGSHKFKVAERCISMKQISSSKKYQRRDAALDNPGIRGKEIARRMSEGSNTVFNDTILVVKDNNTHYIVDGFGRFEAAKVLEWDVINVHVLHGRYDKSSVSYIACCANANNNESKTEFTPDEFAANCLHMFETQRLSVEEIAATFNTNTVRINGRIRAGRENREREKNKDKLSTPATFFSGKEVATVFPKIAAKIIGKGKSFDSYKDTTNYFQDNYNIQIMRTQGYDDQSKQLAFDILEDERAGHDYKYVILAYPVHKQPTVDAAREIAESLQHHFPNKVLFAPITNDEDDFNVRDFRAFIDS